MGPFGVSDRLLPEVSWHVPGGVAVLINPSILLQKKINATSTKQHKKKNHIRYHIDQKSSAPARSQRCARGRSTASMRRSSEAKYERSKQTNKRARMRRTPPGLACATANQKATATLLDQDSQGESSAQKENKNSGKTRRAMRGTRGLQQRVPKHTWTACL